MMVLEFLNSKVMHFYLNHIFVTLISNVMALEPLMDLWPISLYNVLYKLISKVLPHRLKVTLPFFIHFCQSTFILGWLITDNPMVVFKVFHSMKHCIQGKNGWHL